jgi:hypothetical protein
MGAKRSYGQFNGVWKKQPTFWLKKTKITEARIIVVLQEDNKINV